MNNTLISIISPIYRAENSIHILISRLIETLNIISDNFEIILVDDNSPDDSWSEIQKICRKDSRIKGIQLSRNFGQHYAITAGLENAKGEWIVVMDCDLQDRPEEIVNLYNEAIKGFDIVLASREIRKDSFHKKIFSKLFYKALSYLTGQKIDNSVANFGIYHKKVIDSILSMKDSIRYFPTMVNWVGFNKTKINVIHSERIHGESTYNFKKLFKLALDVILINSDKPIRLIIKFGLLMSIFSFSFAAYYLFVYLIGEIEVEGFTSLIISIWFLSGFILMTLGIVGLYIGKTYEAVKNRPFYIVRNEINLEHE
jgi:glycosyltransferase involved in cell wall biosynthesis